jgi:hypothetical protein
LRCVVVPNIRPEATGPSLETAPLHHHWPRPLFHIWTRQTLWRLYRPGSRFYQVCRFFSYNSPFKSRASSRRNQLAYHSFISSILPLVIFPTSLVSIHSFAFIISRQPSGRLLVWRPAFAAHHGEPRANVCLFSGRKSSFSVLIMATPGHQCV